MFKLKYFVNTLFIILLLTGCTLDDSKFTYNNYENYAEERVLINNISYTLNTELSKYMKQSIDSFKDNYDFEIQASALVLDIENNKLIGSYGDINRRLKTHYAFWPISTALLINEYNFDVDTIFENTPYMFEDGSFIRSPISVLGNEEYHKGYISFKESLMDGNDSILFHAIEGKDLKAFYNIMNTIEELNLIEFKDIDYINTEKIEIIGYNVYSSAVEMALLYSSLVNGGKLFTDIYSEEYLEIFNRDTGVQVLEILENLLDTINKNWAIFYNLENAEDFKSYVSATISETADFNEDEFNIWFASIYPSEEPKYVIIFNLSHSLEYLEHMVRMHDFLIVVHDIVNFIHLNEYSNNKSIKDETVYDNFLHQIEDINILLNDNFSGYLYFGRNTCSYCLEFNSYLKDIYTEYPELSIYFFDTDLWRENDNFNLIVDKYNINEVPSLLNISSDGTFDKLHIDIANIEDSILYIKSFLNLN